MAASVPGPDSLYMSKHEPAHGRHRIGGGGEDRGPPAQQLPALAPQHLAQVVEIAVDGLEVGIAALVEDLQVAVGTAEVSVETVLPHVAHELRCLPQQVEARGVLHLWTALAHRQSHPAEHELGIQTVAALLEITAVGH